MLFLIPILSIVILIINDRQLTPVQADSCETCGVSSDKPSKIFNGKEVKNKNFKKYPWLIYLKINKNHSTESCMGFLISSKYVLTASHCLFRFDDEDCQSSNSDNVTGCHPPLDEVSVIPIMNSTSLAQNDKSVTLPLSRVVLHTEWEGFKEIRNGAFNDIALLQLKEEVSCDDNLQPICLPTEDLETKDKDIIIAGMGRDPHKKKKGKSGSKLLQEGVVRRITTDECDFLKKKDKSDLIFCTNGKESNQSACNGDSGSGLFASFDNVYYALAVTSTGKSMECLPKEPVANVNLVSYLPWIEEYVKEIPKPPKTKKIKKGEGDQMAYLRILDNNIELLEKVI